MASDLLAMASTEHSVLVTSFSSKDLAPDAAEEEPSPRWTGSKHLGSIVLPENRNWVGIEP